MTPATAPEVVTFGESMGSLRAAGLLRLGGSLSLTVGGAESNVAIGLARLGHRVAWRGRVGDDEIGALIRRTLQAEGVDVTGLRVDPERSTGLLVIERRIADISRVAYYRSGSAGSAVSRADLANLLDPVPRVLHVTGITPALSPAAADATRDAVRRAVELGIPVTFDVNYRAALWDRDTAAGVLSGLARLAAVVFASDDELELVADGAPAHSGATVLLDAGVGEVVVKRGGAGATVFSREEEHSAPARTVPVADTIGAGDAFTAGYLSALLDGHSLAKRLERGVTLGAFSVAAVGDWEGLPTRSELGLLDQPDGSTVR